ncbi:MAG: hypothetical protein K6F54_13335 [Lachnospiraceae bacterium]|nr:hypothetical protein [Lachnospiraceae bacterium]
MDFEQKVEQDRKDHKLTVDANETFYRARAMRQGVEELRTLSTEAGPLNQVQSITQKDMVRLAKNVGSINFDYDSSRFTLDEVTEAAAFLTKAKEYGYSSEVDVTDNPILYRKEKDENDNTKLTKRGYFEKKSIKKSAKKFRKKYKEVYAARVSEEMKKYKDKDVYDIGEDVSFDATVKFTKEDIDKIRNRDVLKADLNDQTSRFVLGLPAKKLDPAKEESEKRRIDRLYDDFGELQTRMNSSLFKKYLIMQPSLLGSYGSKAVFVPGLFVGVADFYTLTVNYTKWSADPQAYGFVDSEDMEANGGLNTARLKEIGSLMKMVLSLSSMLRQAQEFKGFLDRLIDNGDSFGITEGETEESVKPFNRKLAAKAERVKDELSLRSGGAMRTLIDMQDAILRHSAYLGEDRKQKNNINVLPTLGEYFSERNAYIQFND